VTGSATDPALARALRLAAVAATRAPSVHNTQPWSFVLGPRWIDVVADASRQLRNVDPLGRQLLISCGCAVLNARASLAASGFAAKVERFPDRYRRDLVARIGVDGSPDADDGELAALHPALEARQTNRLPFFDEPVPPDVAIAIGDAATHEATEAYLVTDPAERAALTELSAMACEADATDPARRAELRAWTSDDPGRRDGVPSTAIPTLTDPIEASACLVVLGSAEDTGPAWLRTGEALERVVLDLAGRGLSATPYTSLIEFPRTNVLLRQRLAMAMHPHVLLRVGRAPFAPHTRRRRLVEVIRREDT
jgi:hypothetical protein